MKVSVITKHTVIDNSASICFRKTHKSVFFYSNFSLCSMKWRHSRQETKADKSRGGKIENKDKDDEQDIACGSSAESDSCSSDDENEIDIEAE